MFTFDETFWSNAFFTLVNLLVLYWILKKLLFKPVTKFIDDRNKKIQETIDTANATKEDIENLKLQYEEKIRGAGEVGKKIIEEQRSMAAAEYNSTISAAKKDAKVIIDDAKREIEVEKEKAISELKNEMGNLVIRASEKVIKKNMDTETNRKLVSEFIEDSGVA